MAAVTVIKLTGENHKDLDSVAGQIKTICDTGGITLRGPIPLPTRRLVVPVRKAPDGEELSLEAGDIHFLDTPTATWLMDAGVAERAEL